MNAARDLVAILADPQRATGLNAERWTALLACARAEQLIGTLAYRCEDVALPEPVAQILTDARASARQWRRSALWEAEMARRALVGFAGPVVLMKGTAYIAAGLEAGIGRSIGDLDIMVAPEALGEVEARLRAAGWEWVKADDYDDAYYRRWMHELPPLIHRDRDRMIDVHHTILPPTARITPDATAMLAESVELPEGLRVFAPEDMVLHCVAHLLADGDLAGGLRNLWDFDRLVRQFSRSRGFWTRLDVRARRHGLADVLARALRLAEALYKTPIDRKLASVPRASDALYIRRLLARDGWGRETEPLLRFGFYVRSHWLRMPPLLLGRHLFTKWRKR